MNTIHFAAIVTAAIQFRQALAAHDDRNVSNVIKRRQAFSGHRGRMVSTGKRNGKGTAYPRRGAGSRGKGNANETGGRIDRAGSNRGATEAKKQKAQLCGLG